MLLAAGEIRSRRPYQIPQPNQSSYYYSTTSALLSTTDPNSNLAKQRLEFRNVRVPPLRVLHGGVDAGSHDVSFRE